MTSKFSICIKRNISPVIIFFINTILSVFVLLVLVLTFTSYKLNPIYNAQADINGPESQVQVIYLPTIFNISPSAEPIVNITNILNNQGEFIPEEAALFWFGKVTPMENYADVRIGYFQSNLWVWVSIFDRRLWYDLDPTPEDLTKWDAVSLFLNVDGNGNQFTSDKTFRFDAQLNWWEDRAKFQASYQLYNREWVFAPVPFETHTNWWGWDPNNDLDDRAWVVVYIIPFQSLGVGDMPPEGTEWRLGLELHDRDDFYGTPIPEKVWPQNLLPAYPITWGKIHYGLPSYTPPFAANLQTFTLRNGLNGITVEDGSVGGGTECGSPLNESNFFTQWGDFIRPFAHYLNVQNQGNTVDWPCFSKIYITFPLDSLPEGREVITATLTFHQVGQATGFPDDPPKALNSLIQVWEIGQDWDPATISWNNAPPPIENLSRAWVASIDSPDLGIARTWDVSLLAARAYIAGKPLRLVLYSADFYGPHGKYFFSSTSDDWDGVWRPSLDITLGSP